MIHPPPETPKKSAIIGAKDLTYHQDDIVSRIVIFGRDFSIISTQETSIGLFSISKSIPLRTRS